MKNKIDALEVFLMGKNIQIFCLTEHWMKENEICQIQIQNFLLGSSFCRSTFKGGGSAVFVNLGESFKELSVISKLSIEKDFELSGIFLCNVNVYIVCIYRSPSGDFNSFLAKMDQTLTMIGIQKNIILLGDFNVHFGTKEKDEMALCDLLTSYGFKQMIYAGTRNDKCLDNIFVNFQTDAADASVVDTNLSDHLAQQIDIPVIKQNNNNTIKKTFRPMTQDGKNMFFSILENASWDFISDPRINTNTVANIFTNIIKEAYELAFPKKKTIVSDQLNVNQKWFNKELSDMRDHLNLLSEIARKYPTAGNIHLKKEFHKIYKNTISQTKRKYHDRLIQNSKNKSKCTWDIINNHRNTKKRKQLITHNFTADNFNKYFVDIVPNLRLNNHTNLTFKPINLTDSPNTFFNINEFTFIEIRDIFNKMKNKNSKDIFGLSVKTLKPVRELLIIPITKIVNRCLRESIFPDIWKTALVIPVLKREIKMICLTIVQFPCYQFCLRSWRSALLKGQHSI